MFLENVFAEIVGGVAPDGVDVVGVVLGVVEFDEEGGAVQALVVTFAGLSGAFP